MSSSLLSIKTVPQSELLFAASSGAWTSLGGNTRNTPSSPIFFGGHLYVFSTGADNTVQFVNAGAATPSWISLGGASVASPAVNYAPNGTIAVFVLAQNNQVQVSYVNPIIGGATAWAALAPNPGGVSFTGTPEVALNANQRLEVFILDSTGRIWHTWQNVAGPTWTWVPWTLLGASGRPSAASLVLAPFAVSLLANTGALQLAAVATDGNMYQATQSSSGTGGWTNFVLAAQSGVGVQLANGSASAFSAGLQGPVYAGFNAKASSGNNPLVYAAPPAMGSWTSLNIAGAQAPLSGTTPVMLTSNGVPTLVWVSGGAAGLTQVQLTVQQSATPTSYQWGFVQAVGAGSALFTGQISGTTSGSNVVLAQLNSDGSVSTINYSPS